jgi:CHAT domain-containing protein
MRQALGELRMRLGELEAAEEQLRSALEIRTLRAPDTSWEGESAHALGVLARRRGRPTEALALFRQAAGAFQAQSRRLGGPPEVLARFRAGHSALYRDLESLLVEQGRPEAALEAVEHWRARGLMALLASRDLGFTSDVPAALEKDRRHADADYDRLISRRGAADEAERRALQPELARARAHQDEVRGLIRAAAPRIASVRDPVPLDYEGLRAALDPGTLLLVYSLGEEAARVYALGPGDAGLEVHALAAGTEQIAAAVRHWREQVATRRSARLQGAVRAQAERLGEILLAPVSARLGEARRLLVVPDGALHVLPFGALADPRAPGEGRSLVESLAVHVAASVSLYQQLRATPPQAKTRALEVAAFADPDYAPAQPDGAGPALRGALDEGLKLEPLPWSRAELAALRELAPESERLWTGAEATEERAKALGRGVDIVHFACHGFTDPVRPLESGLALSIPTAPTPEGDNGLLQAWEVFESVRLDAGLVTLSACETGLGESVDGEGLLGLTWAFQYAGARSVLASLWPVADASTAELMRTFYRARQTGLPTAEALQQAQRALLADPATAAPFYWAGFQLVGDWR